MKKVIALVLAAMMVLSLAACGSKTEAPATSTSSAETKTEVKAEGTPNLKAMKKAELQEFATSKGIEVSLKLTKDEMIAAIEAALK